MAVFSPSNDATQRGHAAEGSRVLFLISTFYAFTAELFHLRTLTCHLESRKHPEGATGDQQYYIAKTLWPLMLRVGRVEIDVASMCKCNDCLDNLDLRFDRLDSGMIEACRRFAKCFYSHKDHSVNEGSVGMETVGERILKRKTKELGSFSEPILRRDKVGLLKFVKSIEAVENEYLVHAREDRTGMLRRALVQMFGRRLVERLVDRSKASAGG